MANSSKQLYGEYNLTWENKQLLYLQHKTGVKVCKHCSGTGKMIDWKNYPNKIECTECNEGLRKIEKWDLYPTFENYKDAIPTKIRNLMSDELDLIILYERQVLPESQEMKDFAWQYGLPF